jgi:hypothetical protein
VVPPGDAKALAGRMTALRGDRALRDRLGLAAFAFYDRRLRWESIVGDLARQVRT